MSMRSRAHVANKEAVLDGVVDVIMSEVEEAVDRATAPADDQVEFEFGLDLVLDGLERLRVRR
ncbi:hypothetical protein [Allorhizocola rhizosphaerae]|uniref:hypothetical protein n=1 Tax=Allorhizocola rhizosphaerae TaxID=1872709 RepID=UPI0013C2A2A2|nr:hypothetical protein [Allorhizocola rhizosphaerae]